MRIAVDSYRGEAPRLTPRALPANGAQQALNSRLMTGDLEAFRQFALEYAVPDVAEVLSIFKLNNVWLAWETDVDAARTTIAGDTTFRTFLTGTSEYARPQWTNYAMATSGAAPFPSETRPLGVPPPDSPPGVAAGLDPNPTSFNIDILDTGDDLSAWTVGSTPGAVGYTRLVSQMASFGNPDGSYRLDAANNATQAAYIYRNFGTENCTAFKLTFDFWIQSGTGYGMMGASIQNTSLGDGLQVRWLSDAGLQLAISNSWLYPGGGTIVNDATVNLPTDTWLTCVVEMINNSDGTQTVTATVFNGASEIGSVTVTGTFNTGGYSGLVNCVNLYAITYYDNIHVEGSGSTGYVPINTATSYVYTFVNDIGEESAPSFASSTVLRPDGVAITVTTPTDVPTGISNSEWQIETKRIYRAVTGATGTFYRFVAEIPLATAEYVDATPDTELGEVLASELWALPPVDLQGILALPNGVMAGFSKNQLCLSAQNHPHAWPVEYRLTVDTDIVAIGAIDTTVVIATESFIYLAIGTDPSVYSMTKLEVPQACVSKRSLAYLIGIGVVFASPDGLIAVAGNGNVRNLTSSVFTREQWQALKPESILGVAHDDVYHFFYDTDEAPPAIGYFEDTFEGPAGQSLSGHTPNVAPDDFVWGPSGEYPELQLTGAGSATGGDGESFANTNESNDFTPLLLGATWQVQMDATVVGGVSEGRNELAYFEAIMDVDLSFSMQLEGRPGGGVDMTVSANLPSGSVPVTAFALSDGAHSIVAIVNATGFVVVLDGVPNGSVVADLSSMTQFIRTYLEADRSGNGTSPSFQRVGVYPENTP